MLITQKGKCEKCGSEFGSMDTVQPTNVECSKCKKRVVVCRTCKENGCKCGGKLLEMKTIHVLEREKYSQMLGYLKLNELKADTFGLNEYFPLEHDSAVDKLYKDYRERDGWLENFLKYKIIEKPKNIIWSESGRIDNNQYIYRKENDEFKYEKEKSNYFENVTESKPFCDCIVIDFFGLFGLNHSTYSRKFLNKKAQNNDKYIRYLTNYVKSIMELIKLNEEDFIKLNHIIAAPNETSNSILYYLRNQLEIKKEIKIYKLNSQGLVSKEEPVYDSV